MMACFFCSGILFGNYTARALEPMGHIAGVAAAINGSVSGLVAIAVGTPLGQAYDGTARPFALALLIGSVSALALVLFSEHGRLFRRLNKPGSPGVPQVD